MGVRVLLLTISAAILWSPCGAVSQDNGSSESKETPIVDEFSLVMRNLMKKAKNSSSEDGDQPLVIKVDEIQALLNKSDMQVAKADKFKIDSMAQHSESLETAEVTKFQERIAAERERQMAQLLITKAKIAFAKKTIKNQKQRLAIEKADKAVQAAMQLVEGTKE